MSLRKKLSVTLAGLSSWMDSPVYAEKKAGYTACKNKSCDGGSR